MCSFPKSMKLTKPLKKYSDTTIRHHHNDTTIRQIPGISVAAPIRRSTPWAFITKNFPFVPTIEMSTLFAFPSKNQLNAQGAVTENPGTFQIVVLPHPNNFEVISQPVSLGSDIALHFNGPSCDCLLVRWTWQLYNFGKVNTKVLTCQTV